MKKSKILIPAVAVLALSVGASVTGTVAWFSANRAATVTAQFKAVDAEGALQVLAKKGVGTTTTDTKAATTSAVTVDGSLTHGSYNAWYVYDDGHLEDFVSGNNSDVSVRPTITIKLN